MLIGILDKATTEAHKMDVDEEISVAVVSTPKGDVVIPNVQHLERQMEHAVSTENAIGFQKFMERIASVANERKHSVQELLNFMKRGDLPIADDGSADSHPVDIGLDNALHSDLPSWDTAVLVASR